MHKKEKEIQWIQEHSSRKLLAALAPLLAWLLPAVAAAQPAPGVDELEQLQIRIRAAPRDASTWKIYGLALSRSGLAERAASAFATSCRLDPAESDVCYLSGRVLLSLDRYAEAAAAFDKALREDATTSRPASAHRLAGLAAIGLNRPEQAETHFQRAVALWRGAAQDGSDPRADYAGLLYRSGRLDAAEELLQVASGEQGAPHSALALLGRVRIHQGQPAKAVQPLRDAVAQAPCEWDYRLLLGTALLRMGKVEEGREQMRLGREGWESTAPGPGPVDSTAPSPAAAPCPPAR